MEVDAEATVHMLKTLSDHISDKIKNRIPTNILASCFPKITSSSLSILQPSTPRSE